MFPTIYKIVSYAKQIDIATGAEGSRALTCLRPKLYLCVSDILTKPLIQPLYPLRELAEKHVQEVDIGTWRQTHYPPSCFVVGSVLGKRSRAACYPEHVMIV